MYCAYYQAEVKVPVTWFIGGIFRNEDNFVFERTIDGCSDRIEFFVPESQERTFIELMHDLMTLGYVINFEKLPNRFVS
jgi:hypothetical protein